MPIYFMAAAVLAGLFLLLYVISWSKHNSLQARFEDIVEAHRDLKQEHYTLVTRGNDREQILKRGLQQLASAETGTASLILEIVYGKEDD